MERTLMTVDEAARYLTVSPRLVRRLVFERRIAFVKVGVFVRFERSIWTPSCWPEGSSRSSRATGGVRPDGLRMGGAAYQR